MNELVWFQNPLVRKKRIKQQQRQNNKRMDGLSRKFKRKHQNYNRIIKLESSTKIRFLIYQSIQSRYSGKKKTVLFDIIDIISSIFRICNCKLIKYTILYMKINHK